MAKTKKEPAKVTKHALREKIATTLQTTFAELKEIVGEKKFSRQVKKASKILATGGVKKSAPKAAAPKKAKPAAKVAKKKPAAK